MPYESAGMPQPKPGVSNLEQVLANMELRALKVSYPDERARIFNLAGDICFDSGARERALSYFGRAIDVHLEARQMDAVVSVCKKIVRLTPEVVRARCTLAWLALGRGVIEEARIRITDYARAAATAGQEQTASRHLRLMTDVAVNQEVLQSLAEALLELGDDIGANRAFGAAMGHAAPTAPEPMDSELRWSTVLRMLNGNASGPGPAEVDIAGEFEDLPGSPMGQANRLRRSTLRRRTWN